MYGKLIYLIILLLNIFFLISTNIAEANLKEKFLLNSKYYNWVVFENKDQKEGKICYAAAFPIKTYENDALKREPYIIISLYKKNKIQEFSSNMGTKYKLNSPIFLLIGEKKFELFTDGEFGWLKTKYEDKNLINLMLQSAYLKIRSNSAYGSFAIDEYSLKGFTMAYNRMKILCNTNSNL